MAKNSYEKPDYWSQKAFSEGYPARSVYKLKEIDEKFGMIKKNYTVLDLGSAPGSWTTFLLRQLDGSGKVVSCDLNPLAKTVKGDNLVFIQGDLNAPEIRNQIKSEGPYDLVVCDAAPKTTGNRTVDTARSEQLVEMAIWYAQTMLKPGANFCVKIFQNGDQQRLLKLMRETFTSAKGFKPEACRAESFETYLVGICKK
ncbi:23S rRNA Um-2552 2'-O-methyltransferase [Treponema bryantii]|uniref:Ribosomal RNA large subunit methyltransferase E n=1 Tax=Treponema bryantii TaxID=163 RepID=A0A1H9FVJ1_9SPIR|nr:RlmE family RNA methyltransferase [Treponema bryantii]BDC92705.1 ribosomal RNA large subunit methyltransferase E [Treponema bryantii]SEQ41884.1 23S rRNA Um-2552 2'-O-methyltransferase [Treponema bryantii]